MQAPAIVIRAQSGLFFEKNQEGAPLPPVFYSPARSQSTLPIARFS